VLLQGFIGKNAEIRIFRSVWLYSISPLYQLHKSKLIHQNNVTRRPVLLAKMQGASKGIVTKDLEIENGAPV